MFVKRKRQTQTQPAEQRAFHRVALEAEVTVDSDTNFYYGLSDNISEGGLFINTYRTAEIGSELEVSFTLPGQATPLNVRGRVQWVRESSPLNEEAPPGFGLRFIDPSAEVLNQVRAFIKTREPAFYEP